MTDDDTTHTGTEERRTLWIAKMTGACLAAAAVLGLPQDVGEQAEHRRRRQADPRHLGDPECPAFFHAGMRGVVVRHQNPVARPIAP